MKGPVAMSSSIVVIEADEEEGIGGDSAEWFVDGNVCEKTFLSTTGSSSKERAVSKTAIVKEVEQWKTSLGKAKKIPFELAAMYHDFFATVQYCDIVFCLLSEGHLVGVCSVMFKIDGDAAIITSILKKPGILCEGVHARLLNPLKYMLTTTIPVSCDQLRFTKVFVQTGEMHKPFWVGHGFSALNNDTKTPALQKIAKLYNHDVLSFCLKATCSNQMCSLFTGQRRLKTCATCRIARYCCLECQHLDWPRHKLECKKREKKKK